MQIKINLKIFLFLIIFIITRQIKIYAILMFLALLHELGHLLAGILLGFKPEAISIIPAGFSVQFKAENKNYNVKVKKGNLLSVKKITIAAAGPIVNLVLIVITILYWKSTQNPFLIGLPVDLLIYSNLLIFMFNLIPIYPLDGGRILKEIIHIVHGLYSAYMITNKVSNAVVILLTIIASFAVLIYKNIAILFIIVYLWMLVIKENKKMNLKLAIWKNIAENTEAQSKCI